MTEYFRTPCTLSETKKAIKDGLEFQVLEWQDTDEDYVSVEDTASDNDCDSDPEPSEVEYTKHYLIRAFGVTADSKSVCLNIQDYTPFFYIKVPSYFTESNKASLLEYIESRRFPVDKTWYTFRGCLIKEQCRYEEKKDFYGFQNNKKHKFIRLVFRSLVAMKQASYLFNKPIRIDSISVNKTYWFNKYESNVDQLIRFVHTRELQTAGWINVDKDHLHIDNASTSCQMNFSCLWVFVNPDDERTDIAPLVQASFDIECFSEDYSFPRPEVAGNVVTAIATAFKRYGDPDFFLKHVITLKKSNPLQNISGNVILECYNTEREVLLAWKRLICGMDPDIIYSYNGDQFDCNYLIARSKNTRAPNGANCYDEFSQLSRVKGFKCDISEQTFSSGAYGSTDFKRLGIPGRINFDILIYIKRELKLDSYKLDNVAEKYLKEKKHDVSVAQIFDYFRSSDPEKIRVITEYCVQDTLLPQRLVDKLDILPIQIEMARITYVPFRYLIEKGQQIKVFSQLVKRTRKAGFLIPHLKYSNENNTKFKGAYVLDPVVGAHFDPVATLDFASLYPTIMMAHNFCYSSIVLDKQYLGLEGVEYHRVKWKETNEDNQSYNFDYSFVQNTETVIPTLLSDLYKSRKMVKKLMGKETDPFKKSVLNGRQLAIKVSMNSVYGFLAAQTLCCKPISASVTATGREMIDATSRYAETTFVDFVNNNPELCKGRTLKCKTIYGDTDSVFLEFNTGKKGVEAMKESFQLAEICADMATKALFKPPILLEFEKVYSILLMFKKKMYIGALHETSPEKYDYIDTKGVVLKRRDNCPLLKTVYQGALDKVIAHKQAGVPDAIAFIRKWIRDLVNNKVDVSQLTLSKSLSGGYAEDCNTPHVVLARKLMQRDPGSAPKPGDRVPYVFVNTGNPKHKQFEKVEDPEYVRKKGLKVDTVYYIEHQLKNPLVQFLSLFESNPVQIFEEELRESQNKLSKQNEITRFFTTKSKRT